MNVLQRTNIPFLAQEEYLELLIQTFLETKKAENVASGTMKFYQDKLAMFNTFCQAQEIKQISQITSNTIRQFLLHLREHGNNDGGSHAHYRSVKTFLKWYEREFEPDNWKNPISKVKAPRVSIEPLEPVILEDVEKMIACCSNDLIGRRDKAMLYMLLDTGVRASELLAIRLDEIDIITGECLIRKGKGRKPRVIYMGDRCRRVMRRYLKLRHDNCPMLFITDDGEGGLGYWGLKSKMKRLSMKAGVPTPSIHSFRYYYALTALRSGMNVFSLQKAGGWASLAVMRRYLKQTESDVEMDMKNHSPLDHVGV